MTPLYTDPRKTLKLQ
ncbi:hypothetical protein A3Q56_06331 [Intoshia linei]|uniref:Uncharacterized protein n=1 Tax=Intoshia linei TaxID=1819745 RepID=A0A177AWR7_9BILA|nr:hypothetical protein A3Q56_06331 [Intoshia linei]